MYIHLRTDTQGEPARIPHSVPRSDAGSGSAIRSRFRVRLRDPIRDPIAYHLGAERVAVEVDTLDRIVATLYKLAYRAS
jgi:hypothetical protein